jgi:glucose/mannose-6-phosphate isomerase
MWEATLGLPEQVATAAGMGPVEGLPEASDIRQVVVLGMGGSGVAGDVLGAIAGPRLKVPVSVVKSYDLPGFVGPETLVFAVSFSGDTEEVLAASDAAWSVGASVVAVTGGGRLRDEATAHGAPVLAVPSGIPQPRAALGALAVPPLVVLEQLGLMDGLTPMLAAAVRQLEVRRDELAGASSPAAEAADRIGRTFPLAHGSDGLAGVAARRFKTQVNENAKSPAFFDIHPELCHNEVAGWGQHGDVTRQVITLVTMRCPDEHPQVARRFDLVTEILREVVADVIEFRAAGDGPLAHLFDLALLGDVVSLCLAAAEGLDPGPVPVLGELKTALRR